MMRRILCPSFVLLLFLLLPFSAHSGGAIKTDILGNPLHWQPTLTFNPDKGALRDNNPAYDHAGAVQIMKDAFATWTDSLGKDAVLSVIEGEALPLNGDDIDTTNFGDFFSNGTMDCYDEDPNTPCFTPVVFDKDGEILDDLFGECAKFSILGFAGEDDIEDGSGNPDLIIVRRGQALFSGACIPDVDGKTITKPGCAPCKRSLTDGEIRTVITHEMGHMMGMDHSQVNPDSYGQCLGATGCPEEVKGDLPTMFPILVQNAGMETLHRDDEAYFERIYGSTAHGCTISGKVFASDGSTEVRGVEVVARNTDPNLSKTDAISFVSGAEAPRFNNSSKRQGNCKENCGNYLITGLNDRQNYQICAQKIQAQFTGGSSIEPLDPPFRNFSNTCPSELTVSCDCSSGTCSTFASKDITTDADPASIDKGADEQAQINDTGGASSGGCSLQKPEEEAHVWPIFRHAIRQMLNP